METLLTSSAAAEDGAGGGDGAGEVMRICVAEPPSELFLVAPVPAGDAMEEEEVVVVVLEDGGVEAWPPRRF